MTSASGVEDAYVHAYLAGIIDGEGCFSISRRSDRHYSPLISVGMVEQTVINKLKETYGGNVYKEEGKYRPIYKWQVRNFDSIIVILDKLKPYLTVKCKSAELLREFISGRSLGYKRLMTEEEVTRRADVYRRIKEANAVGMVYRTMKEI